MNRIVVDVLTGEVAVVALTPEEIAEINARPPEPAPVPPAAPTLAELQAQLTALQAQITALAP